MIRISASDAYASEAKSELALAMLEPVMGAQHYCDLRQQPSI